MSSSLTPEQQSATFKRPAQYSFQIPYSASAYFHLHFWEWQQLRRDGHSRDKSQKSSHFSGCVGVAKRKQESLRERLWKQLIVGARHEKAGVAEAVSHVSRHGKAELNLHLTLTSRSSHYKPSEARGSGWGGELLECTEQISVLLTITVNLFKYHWS